MARWSNWRPYVPVWKRQVQAEKLVRKLAKQGRSTDPVVIEGREIARSFWGRAWCENLERYSDYDNRLPRGRTYVRNGSVIDLKIARQKVHALVRGQSIYDVEISVAAVAKARWAALKRACSGRFDSVVELLQGAFSRAVMEVFTSPRTGLFPALGEIEMRCSCPDWATMCKHVAAVLYGIGSRLDTQPDLLFLLRGIDHTELVAEAAARATAVGRRASGSLGIEGDELAAVFGIELEAAGPKRAAAREAGKTGKRRRAAAAQAPARRTTRDPASRERAAAARAAQAPARRTTRDPASRERAAGARAAAASKPRAESRWIQERLSRLRAHLDRSAAVTNADYRELFGVEALRATSELQRLCEAGVLVQEGRKRGTRYVAGSGLTRS